MQAKPFSKTNENYYSELNGSLRTKLVNTCIRNRVQYRVLSNLNVYLNVQLPINSKLFINTDFNISFRAKF